MAHDGAASAGDFAVNHAKGVFTNRPIDRTADIKTKCLLRGGLRIVPGDPQVSLVATGDSPLVLRQAIKRAAVALTRSGATAMLQYGYPGGGARNNVDVHRRLLL